MAGSRGRRPIRSRTSPSSRAGTACGMRALRPAAAMRKPMAVALPDRIDRERAAARDGLAGDDQHVQQQLDPVFRQQHARQIPGELGLAVLDESRAPWSRRRRDRSARRPSRPRRRRAGRIAGAPRPVVALFLMRSSAKFLVSSSLSSSSSTSSPLTIAPVGLIRSWQTREHSSAARSRASRATAADMRTSPVGGPRLSGTVSAGARLRIVASLRRCDTPQPLDLPRLDLPRPAGTQTWRPQSRTRRSRGVIQDGDIGALDGRLLDELTTIVSRRGRRHPCGTRRSARRPQQGRPFPGHRRRPCGRGGDSRRPGPRAPRRAGRVGRGGSRALPADLPGSFVLVDPLDGTRELLAGRDEFTVNSAIVTAAVRASASSPRRRRACCGAGSRAEAPSACSCRPARQPPPRSARPSGRGRAQARARLPR